MVILVPQKKGAAGVQYKTPKIRRVRSIYIYIYIYMGYPPFFLKYIWYISIYDPPFLKHSCPLLSHAVLELALGYKSSPEKPISWVATNDVDVKIFP